MRMYFGVLLLIPVFGLMVASMMVVLFGAIRLVRWIDR